MNLKTLELEGVEIDANWDNSEYNYIYSSFNQDTQNLIFKGLRFSINDYDFESRPKFDLTFFAFKFLKNDDDESEDLDDLGDGYHLRMIGEKVFEQENCDLKFTLVKFGEQNYLHDKGNQVIWIILKKLGGNLELLKFDEKMKRLDFLELRDLSSFGQLSLLYLNDEFLVFSLKDAGTTVVVLEMLEKKLYEILSLNMNKDIVKKDGIVLGDSGEDSSLSFLPYEELLREFKKVKKRTV